ncbi:MAG: hypothetical protein K2M47_03685 [Clostridiales bacterium]|nr:hypothetical protein [Clostridiales bacterium]
MRTAFIIFAIFAAVVLLVCFAAPAAVPRFFRAERITHGALIKNIRSLGKKCAITEYGQGIRYGSIKIRTVIAACKKRADETVEDWQRTLCAASDNIKLAFSDGKSAARYSAYCGHVGKYPRIFLFCERLTRDSGCEITHDLLIDAISAFEENAEFSLSERKILCGMLKLCLIGYLYISTENAIRRGEEYDRGASDGIGGNVNLDYLNEDDYVCGLMQACSESERCAVTRLLEYNGVDISGADSRRRARLAHTYVTVNSVLRSLAIIDECKDEIYTPKTHGNERVKRYVKVFNILFPILLAVYAVFTCVFASPKYVALFSIAAIITYAVMRIPVLLYSPTSGIDIFAPIEALLRKSQDSKNTEINVDNRLQLSEAAYFGSEPQYIKSVIDGTVIKVCCDNRGSITVNSDITTDSIYIGIRSDGINLDLSECDWIMEGHRAVYRACNGDLELCAETIAPIDGNVCIMRLTVINRCDYDKTVTVTGAVVRKQPESQKCITQNIRGGAMAVCDNCFALSLIGGNYGGDLHAFCDDGTLKHGSVDVPALIGVATLDVKRFSRVVSYMTVIYASRTQAENMFEYVSDDLYYARAVEGAAVYCKPSVIAQPETQISGTVRRHAKPAVFAPPPMPEQVCDYSLPFGGISQGDVVIANNHVHKPIDNTVVGGRLSLKLNQFGIQKISIGQDSFTVSVDKFTYSPRAFVIIGEDGVMWSPTVKPIGEGQTRTVHSHGYTEYTCAHNGTVCVQKCFTAIGMPILFVDITLYNKTDVERQFDVMFSTVCDSRVNVALSGNGVTAETGKSKLMLRAVGNQAEYAAYKEAYFVYGNIDRTSGFRIGGSAPAPTASVRKNIQANDSARVVFCIADSVYADKLSSVSNVDKLLDGIKRFYGRLGRISPATDDGIMNISYTQSLYRAYCAFAAQEVMPLYSECFVLSAVKYVDPAAVKNKLYAIMSEQNQSGLLGSDYSDCLQAVQCIIEYVEYTHDDGFWNEVLPYAALRSHGKRVVIKDTVYNHVLRAVGYLIANPVPLVQGIVQSVWQYKSLIYVLRFAESKFGLSGNIYAQYKKRFDQAAEGYSHGVKRLTENNFFQFKSITEAYMCARLLFDLDLNEKAYNIIKFNNPIERCLHYGIRDGQGTFDYFYDAVAAAVYFTTVTERLFGVKFRGKTLKICPHIAQNTPQLKFDIYGKSKDVRITVDGSELCGNWKMKVNKINYPADSVDIRNLSDDIVFYLDGNE